MLNLVCLLNLDANPDAVNTWLDQDSFILVPRNSQWIQEYLRGGLRFDFWNIVPFGSLGREV